MFNKVYQKIKSNVYSELSSEIYLIGIGSLINGIGSFLFPFIPLILTKKLGYTVSHASIFTMVALFTSLTGTLLISKFADNISRKRIMVITQYLMATCLFFCGYYINSQPHIVPIIMLLSFFFDGMTDPARGGFQADITTKENRKVAYSFFYLCHNIGFSFGPAIAGFLFARYTSFIFYGNALTEIITISLIGIFVADHRPTKQALEESKRGCETDKAVEGSLLQAMKARPLIVLYIAIDFLTVVSFSSLFFALPLYTSQLFGDAGSTKYGFLMTANAITVIILTPLFTQMTKQHQPIILLTLASLFTAIGIFNLGFIHQYFGIIILMIIYSVGEVLHATNHEYFVINHTPMGHRARFSSLLITEEVLGFALGVLLCGLLIDTIGFQLMYISLGSLPFIASIGLFLLRKALKEETQTNKNEETKIDT